MNVVSLVLIAFCFTMLVTVMDISFAEVSSPTTRPTITFDKIVYTWTDKVHITVLAPEYNLDSDTIDEIGNTVQNPVNISTGNHTLDQYKLVETGPNTGVFTGYIILTGFEHDADGDNYQYYEYDHSTNPRVGDGNGTTIGLGPTNGFLENTNDDTITISFKFSEDETIVKSTLIKWNIGKVQWLQEITHSRSIGIIRIIDPDMNLDPESIDKFEVDVWSTRDSGGMDLIVKETGNATGIFEGTLFTTTGDGGPGGRLHILEGSTITALYKDNTLPHPYDPSDELYIEDSHILKKEPLERVSIRNFSLKSSEEHFTGIEDYPIVKEDYPLVSDKPTYLTIPIRATQNYVNEECVFIAQIENANNEVVYLEMSNHSLNQGSKHVTNIWIPDMPGTYTVTIFVWESIDNPVPLSPQMVRTVLVTPALSEN